MSYKINLTNGQELIDLSDGFVDTSKTSLVLVGKNYAGYGEFINENFVKLLENFSSTTQPPNPLRGQLWWDTTNNILKVYSGTSWKISTGATSSPFSSPPGDLSALGGDLWFDSTNRQLKVYSGADWITVGPFATPATGDTGAFPSIMTDTSGGSHIVVQIRIVGVPYIIISKDTFVSSLPGFALVKAGINFSTIASPILELSTQDINATPSTLVQRNLSGGINVIGLNATSVTAGAVTATTVTGTFSGNLAGNVTATSVTSGTVSAAGITATSGYSGTLLTASQPNVTSLGTLTGLNVNGNVAFTATSATLNGAPIATLGGSGTFTAINNTPIGNAVPNTGAFTTLSADQAFLITTNGNVINAAFVGNTGTVLTGTLATASQPNITSASSLATVGNITSGTWSAGIISPRFGGTGVNNGNNTLTVTGNFTINQNVASGSSPTLVGTNFSSIPNSALTGSGAVTVTAGTGMSGGGSVSLGGSVTLNNAGVTSISAGTGVDVSAGTGSVTVSIGQAVGTSSGVRFGSLGVGTPASGTTGEIRATNNITAYFSDDRLKTRLGTIENALDKVMSLTGFYYHANETAQDLGYTPVREVGLSAQDLQKALPEVVKPAPIDEKYLTAQYERVVPLLVEAIKELKLEINQIRDSIEKISIK